MNVQQPIKDTSTPVVLSVAFNNNAANFSVGLDTGICVYISETCQLRSSVDFNGGFGLVQMMGSTNLIGLVGGGKNPKFAPTKVVIWDDIQHKLVVEITGLKNIVRGLQLSKNRIIVAMQNKVQVYSLEKKPKILASYETANNLLGLCRLTNKLLAFPGRTDGQLQLVHLDTESVSIIPAHTNSLQCITLSRDGEYVATASEKGTIINVFSTSSGAKMANFRRGADSAVMFDLAFSPSGKYLACTSDKLTLHLFDIGKHTNPSPSEAGDGNTDTIAAGTSSTPALTSTRAWGFLGKLPLMPRIFRDEYSFVSAPFECGSEPLVGGIPLTQSPTLGTSRPPKGIIGWVSENSLVVVGAGQDPRWEKFAIVSESGGPKLFREGWKRYANI